MIAVTKNCVRGRINKAALLRLIIKPEQWLITCKIKYQLLIQNNMKDIKCNNSYLLMKICILLLLFCSITSHAQLKQISFHLSPNFPLIGNSKTTEQLVWGHPSASIVESYKGRIGFTSSSTIDYQLSHQFFISSGLQIQYIRYKRDIEISFNQSSLVPGTLPIGNFVVQGSPLNVIQGSTPLTPADYFGGSSSLSSFSSPNNLGETTALYCQVPILAGAHLLKGKLFIKAGPSVAFLARGTFERKRFYSSGGVETEIDKSGDGFTNTLLNGLFSVSWSVWKNINTDLMYLHSFSAINENGNAKYNVLSLGISYNLQMKSLNAPSTP
jgi:hypothetical protein